MSSYSRTGGTLIIHDTSCYETKFFTAIAQDFWLKIPEHRLPHLYGLATENWQFYRFQEVLDEDTLRHTPGIKKLYLQYESAAERWELHYMRTDKYEYYYRGDLITTPVKSYHLLDAFNMQYHSTVNIEDFKREENSLARVEILQQLTTDELKIILQQQENAPYRLLILTILAHRMPENKPQELQECCDVEELYKLLFTTEHPDRAFKLPLHMTKELLNPRYNLLRYRHKLVRQIQRAFWDHSADAHTIAQWIDMLYLYNGQATIIHDLLREVAFHTTTARAQFAHSILLEIAQNTTQPHILQYLFPINLAVAELAAAVASQTFDRQADSYYRESAEFLPLAEVLTLLLDRVYNPEHLANLLNYLLLTQPTVVSRFVNSRPFLTRKLLPLLNCNQKIWETHATGAYELYTSEATMTNPAVTELYNREQQHYTRTKESVTSLLRLARDLRKQQLKYKSAIRITQAAVLASRIHDTRAYRLHSRATKLWNDPLFSTYHRHCMLQELGRKGEPVADPEAFVRHRVLPIFLFREFIYFDMKRAILQQQQQIHEELPLDWQQYMGAQSDIPLELLLNENLEGWQLLVQQQNSLAFTLMAFIENPTHIEFLLLLAEHTSGAQQNYLRGIARLLDPAANI